MSNALGLKQPTPMQGDAAHASSPVLGQGGCLAMEDAVVLAETLQTAASISGALDDFENRHKPRVKWVQQQSLALFAQIRPRAGSSQCVLARKGRKDFARLFPTVDRGAVVA
jgi:2-polyprenyl-6-methoxyphenol hydroxylase-like FAD-dependent oxidoreductase